MKHRMVLLVIVEKMLMAKVTTDCITVSIASMAVGEATSDADIIGISYFSFQN